MMLVFCAGMVALIIAGIAVYFTGAKNAAWIVTNGGTVVWMFGWLAYLSIWHSRDRWPNTSAWERLMRVLSFTR